MGRKKWSGRVGMGVGSGALALNTVRMELLFKNDPDGRIRAGGAASLELTVVVDSVGWGNSVCMVRAFLCLWLSMGGGIKLFYIGLRTNRRSSSRTTPCPRR